MITDFPAAPLANMPGVQGFTYVPYRYVQQLPRIIRSMAVQPILFFNGFRLYNGFSTPGELDFTETCVTSANGPTYEWQITGFVPGDDDELVNLFEEMESCRHLVCVKDKRGVQRLVGIGAPLVFTAKFNDGKKVGDARGYSFTFANTGKNRAPVYQP
jgi:hypothetical protein